MLLICELFISVLTLPILPRGAQRIDGAGLAFRLSRKTRKPPMPNHPVRKINPVFFCNYFVQFKFNLNGIDVLRQTETAGNPLHVRIDHDPRNSEGIPQNNVGGLSADSRKYHEILHAAWNPAAETLHEIFRTADDAFCFCSVEARRADFAFEGFGNRICIIFGRFVFLEKGRCYQIDALVGALCRQNGRNQELHGVSEMKRNLSIRDGLLKTPVDFSRPPAFRIQIFAVRHSSEALDFPREGADNSVIDDFTPLL